MHQATQVLIAGICGGAGIGLLILIRLLPRPRTAPAAVPTSAVRTAYRWCPIEQRTVAAFQHRDGSATCADDRCGAHIPATEEVPRA